MAQIKADDNIEAVIMKRVTQVNQTGKKYLTYNYEEFMSNSEENYSNKSNNDRKKYFNCEDNYTNKIKTINELCEES